jgi:hypothetical protein
MKDTPLVSAAIEYLNAGLSIIALAGKMPNATLHPNGTLNAIQGTVETDEDRGALRAYFNHPRTTGVAILIPEHVLVADVDSEAAAAVFMDMAGVVPHTPTARTRNGFHIWLTAPGAAGSRWVGERSLLFKGLGGYVAAPPSRHPSGFVYEWVTPLVEDGMIRGMEWLPDRLAEELSQPSTMEGVAIRREPYMVSEAVHEDGVWRVVRREASRIESLAHGMAGAKEGNRNNYLSWASMTAAEQGVPYEEAYPALLAAAIEAGSEERESRVTIRSAYRRRGTAQ